MENTKIPIIEMSFDLRLEMEVFGSWIRELYSWACAHVDASRRTVDRDHVTLVDCVPNIAILL